ncbi:Receptor-like protein kinase FERONIA [Camellia lanceoleosa]|nr:Receptor-like protein kinase FERONIA [Camellia lanceoleosa]
MRFSHFSTLILAHSIFLQCCFCTIASDYATLHSLVDNIAINCGASGKSIAVDGGEWIGDIGFSNLAPFKSTSSKSNHRASDTVSPVPYMTARISSSQFSYTLQLSPGQKFIRLHFYPTSYSGFGRSKAFFTVKAGPYTLLSNFSASLAADALGLKSFAREFCVNVEENRALTITFSPSPASYAFINGIEIVSMPAGLYYTDSGIYVVGQKYKNLYKKQHCTRDFSSLEYWRWLDFIGGRFRHVPAMVR